MKHTKLPWEISIGAQEHPFSIEGPDSTIAFIKRQTRHLHVLPDVTEANAEFIARACNAHYDLFNALKDIRYSVKTALLYKRIQKGVAEDLDEIALRAITKAEGK